MKQKQIESSISKLIYKSVIKSISVEEKEILGNWLLNPENKVLYDEIVNKNNIQNKYELFQRIDSDGIYKRLEAKIFAEKSKEKELILKSRWLKYAVAASIVLAISLTIIIFKKDSFEERNPKVLIISENIKIGGNKAILTLEDGSEIALEGGQNYFGQNIESNGEEIIYSSRDGLNTEVAFNYLTVPRGGQYFLQLSDGTKVWLNSESKIKYPVSFLAGIPRSVELLYGEAYFKVSSSEKNNGTSFIVTHTSQEVIVLGTEFNIKAYREEDHIYTTLVEGKIALKVGEEQEILSPNEQYILNVSNGSWIRKSAIDVLPEIEWKKGLFNFKDKTLFEIMQVLSRWFDVEVLFEDPTIKSIRFKGVLKKDQNIEEILTLIKNTKFINDYKIEGNKIILK